MDDFIKIFFNGRGFKGLFMGFGAWLNFLRLLTSRDFFCIIKENTLIEFFILVLCLERTNFLFC